MSAKSPSSATSSSEKPDASQAIDKYMQTYGRNQEALLHILQDIQNDFRCLPEAHLRLLAEKLAIPVTQVYSVATFFRAFSLKPKGRYVIQVCTGTACHLKGAGSLLTELKTILQVREGETTADGLFSVEAVRCLGCCSLAPAVMINGQVYGELDVPKLRNLLETYRLKVN